MEAKRFVAASGFLLVVQSREFLKSCLEEARMSRQLMFLVAVFFFPFSKGH